MKTREIKLVVFDIAGTTIKDENFVHLSLIKALSTFGYDASVEEANVVMGYPKPYAIKELLKIKELGEKKITTALVHQIHEVFIKEMIHFYETSNDVVPVNNAEETFLLLKKLDIKIALNTGFSKNITDVIISRLKWKERRLIDAYISSDEVEDGRPHPYMIQSLMRELGVSKPEEVAKVGDTISDLQEGSNANCKYIIGITTGAYKKEILEKYTHTHLIDNLLEIVNIVTK